MRITVVLPFAFWTGGVRSVYEHSRRLKTRGHDVRVVFPRAPYWFRTGRGFLADGRAWAGAWRRNLISGAHPPGAPVAWGIEMVPAIADRYLPDADIVLATAWPTAYSVARLAARKGVKAYLVQHREIDSGPVQRVDGTYHLGLFLIAGSRFTARHLQETVGVTADAVALSGVDVEFWRAAPPSLSRSGVLTPLAGSEHKGGRDAIATLDAVHRARPGVRLRAFGQSRPTELPPFIEYHDRPDDVALRDLYAGAEVFVYSSRFEGFGLPPLEAQAAGCAVVSTRVGDVPEFLQDGENGVLVEPRDVDAMSRAVLGLLADPARRARLGAAAAASAISHDWERATDTLERAFERALGKRAQEPARAQG